MAKVEDFVDSNKIKEQLKEAYEKGYHFQWIGITSTVLEQLTRAYLYTSIMGDKQTKPLKGIIDSIRKMSLGQAIQAAYFRNLISAELYQDIKEFNNKRNLVMHNLIFKLEKVEKIDLGRLFLLGQKNFEALVTEWLNYERIRMISDKVFDEMLKKFERKFQQDTKKD